MPDQSVLLFIVGLFAGVLSGMFGIGGGVVIVPALVLLLGFEIIEATSTSLGALLLPVGIFAVIQYYRAGLLKIRESALVAIGLIVTTYFGAVIAVNLPEDTLRQAYGVFLLYVAWRMAEPRKIWAEFRHENPPATPKDATSDELPDVHWAIVLAVGLVAGLASGMFGIGGGAVIVPALVVFLHYPQKLAVGTSLGALLLPVGLPGVLKYLDEGVLDLGVAMVVAFGLLIGAIFGARLAIGMASKTIKRLYGIFLFLIAMNFIFGITNMLVNR